MRFRDLETGQIYTLAGLKAARPNIYFPADFARWDARLLRLANVVVVEDE